MTKKITLTLGALLLLFSGAAYALTILPRFSWAPAVVNPASITLGSSYSRTITLTHTGILPVPTTSQLQFVAEGDVAKFVKISSLSFSGKKPGVFQKGDVVKATLTVTAPTTTPYLRVSGRILLTRVLPNGKGKDVFRDVPLTVSFTFSNVSLPPYPNEAENNATIAGIDIGGAPDGGPNGVRDDLDHWIAQEYPESEKRRAAMTVYAREEQKFLTDFLALQGNPTEQKRVTRANAVEGNKAQYCLYYVLGNVSSAAQLAGFSERRKATAQFLNTDERDQAYMDADYLLAGTGGGGEGWDPRALCEELGFDPNTMAN